MQQARTTTKPLKTGVRQKRRREEEESRERAEELLDDCPLHVIADTVEKALSYFEMLMAVASAMGAERFRSSITAGGLYLLTAIVVASVPSVGIPVRQGVFRACLLQPMRAYLEAVQRHPEAWKTAAPTSTRFKNSLSKHFTHEALCLPPRVCKVLQLYDVYVAAPVPPHQVGEVTFFRSSSLRPLSSFAEHTRMVMRLWGPRTGDDGRGGLL